MNSWCLHENQFNFVLMCVPRAVCFSPTSTVVTENAPFFLRPSCNCSPLVSHCFEAKEKASLAQLIHSRFPANSPHLSPKKATGGTTRKKSSQSAKYSRHIFVYYNRIRNYWKSHFLSTLMERKDLVLVKQFKTVVTCAAFLGLVSEQKTLHFDQKYNSKSLKHFSNWFLPLSYERSKTFIALTNFNF